MRNLLPLGLATAGFSISGPRPDVAAAEGRSWPARQDFDARHVAMLETTDGTLGRGATDAWGMPEADIGKAAPRTYVSDGDGALTVLRECGVAYRGQIEGDSAEASVDPIKRHADQAAPRFL